MAWTYANQFKKGEKIKVVKDLIFAEGGISGMLSFNHGQYVLPKGSVCTVVNLHGGNFTTLWAYDIVDEKGNEFNNVPEYWLEK